MNQIFLGSLFPFVVAVAIYLKRRGEASIPLLLLTPLFMMAGAVWAVVPDLPRLFGHDELYHRLATDPRTNLFFWHYTIDRIETTTLPYFCGVTLMALSLLTMAWREPYRMEKE